MVDISWPSLLISSCVIPIFVPFWTEGHSNPTDRHHGKCKCEPDMVEYTKSKSCRRRQILDFFKVTSQGRRIEKKHLCCDVCAQDCACGQDCPQNVGTMVSKMTLPAGDDAPKGRSVKADTHEGFCSRSMLQAHVARPVHTMGHTAGACSMLWYTRGSKRKKLGVG